MLQSNKICFVRMNVSVLEIFYFHVIIDYFISCMETFIMDYIMFK